MKFAIKRLRHSDLTFFAPYFRSAIGSKQKAINLDAKIIADEFFPLLSRANPDRPRRLLLEVSICGPRGASPIQLARKVVLEGKNWRLNGEMVNNPEDDPTRFDLLAPDDIAVMSFEGEAAPSAVSIALFASACAQDRAVFSALDAAIGEESMVVTDTQRLSAMFSGLPDEHPALILTPDAVFEAALEDAAAGGVAGSRCLNELSGAGIRRVDAATLSRTRQRDDESAAVGEDLIASLLEREQAEGRVAFHVWVSKTNAASPYTFSVTEASGSCAHISVKTTTGEMERALHVSAAELMDAASGIAPWRIFRVYQLNPGSARLRRSADLSALAKEIIEHSVSLPRGVSTDGFSIDPALLDWSDEEVLESD